MPNIIFISMDTTRYDHINTGDGARARTPALKRFAREACDFKKAFVTIPETLPSHLSIFTSHYPHELGVTQNHSRFDGRFKMIQETLKENGYTNY
jgi:arylsulfatase A-like enzyme